VRIPQSTFASLALRWYAAHKRDLPWRRTRDPYRIWVSEIMLQQTRVEAVIPFYERFLKRFPDAAALARAPEAAVLAAWAGLGYYSRARNLHKAARLIVAQGGFPREHAAIRALPGVGDYTAAAISSIAFGLPHAVLDGNTIRVLARISNEPGDVSATATKRRLAVLAESLLDPRRPGDFNQALMELGATVCLPRSPRCPACPLARLCEARRRGVAEELPVKPRKAPPVRLEREFLVIRRAGCILLWQRPSGFWELPEPAQLPRAVKGEVLARFRHTITNHRYAVTVLRGSIRRAPAGFVWVAGAALARITLSTLARKALER
jgi:A/G-specific adenine glycosylase